MISFKQYLTEARMAPLYHATYMNNAQQILLTDVLKPSAREGKYIDKRLTQGVSLTRSLKTAREWRAWSSLNVTFELDQQKLSQNYKIKPLNMVHVWNHDNPELVRGLSAKHEELFEEMIDKPIKPLSKYLTKVIVFSEDYFAMPDEIRKHPLLYNYNKKKFVNK